MNTLADLEEVPISRHDFEQMLGFSRLMFRLKRNPQYVQAMQNRLPDIAHLTHDEPSMLMGFDFHLTDNGPRLIEVNNNAGGLYVGDAGWLSQYPLAEMSGDLGERLVKMFPESWRVIAIMDEDISQQYMYPEMLAYAELLRKDGRTLFLVSPEDLIQKDDGLYIEGQRVDAIYNRHTDFYLEERALQHIRDAMMKGQVKLNPHPRSYALLGDKARMVDWWSEGLLEQCLAAEDIAMIRQIVPEIHLLGMCDLPTIWRGRKDWVFKPTARHGGKGVVLGKGISRKRFDDLDGQDTVVQAFVPASQVEHQGVSYKLDIRLFMQGEDLIALAGRLWRGQVTNFREEGSGWTVLRVEDV